MIKTNEGLKENEEDSKSKVFLDLFFIFCFSFVGLFFGLLTVAKVQVFGGFFIAFCMGVLPLCFEIKSSISRLKKIKK